MNRYIDICMDIYNIDTYMHINTFMHTHMYINI